MTSAEEFFRGIDSGERPTPRKSRTRGKPSSDDLFAKVKTKMVMRIYGVSRAKALEIIAARDTEIIKAAVEKHRIEKERHEKAANCIARHDDEELFVAEEFFA